MGKLFHITISFCEDLYIFKCILCTRFKYRITFERPKFRHHNIFLNRPMDSRNMPEANYSELPDLQIKWSIDYIEERFLNPLAIDFMVR
jgi:hypothetical protein